LVVTFDNQVTSGSTNFTSGAAIIAGDPTGSLAVTSSDISATKVQTGQPVTSSNCRADVTPNGSTHSSGVGEVKLHSGALLGLGLGEFPCAKALSMINGANTR
jgi:hypothetical protein